MSIHKWLNLQRDLEGRRAWIRSVRCLEPLVEGLTPGLVSIEPSVMCCLLFSHQASSVLAREGAGCGSVGDVPGAWPRAMTRSASPRAWRPDFPGAAREAP